MVPIEDNLQLEIERKQKSLQQSSYLIEQKINSIQKMPLRKNRVPGQGVTNSSSLTLLKTKSSLDIGTTQSFKNTNNFINKSFNHSQSQSKFDLSKTSLTEHHPFYYTGINQNSSFNSSDKKLTLLPKKHFATKFEKSQQQKQLTENAANVLDKMRTTYKYNANVRKIAKAWGFQSKGYISNEKFQEMVNKHFDSSITKQNCDEMLRSVGSNNENVDLMSFVKLVFDQEPFTKPDINVLKYEQTCQKNKQTQNSAQSLMNRISNLNQGSIVHNDNSEAKANRSSALPYLNVDREQKGFSNSYLQFKNTNMQKTQPSLYQTMHSESNPKFIFSTTKSHTLQLTPTNFQGINQQKTRFNATPPILLNDQSLPENKREKIFDSKLRVLQDLASQQRLQKMRYMNKLQVIRQHHEKEKENVMEIDRKAQERDRSNMKKFREENLAYNYVNFIHNSWK